MLFTVIDAFVQNMQYSPGTLHVLNVCARRNDSFATRANRGLLPGIFHVFTHNDICNVFIEFGAFFEAPCQPLAFLAGPARKRKFLQKVRGGSIQLTA